MFSIEKSVTIDLPAEQVFAFISDLANDRQWLEERGITPSGPLATGATFHVARDFVGQEFESTVEITAYEPPHQVCAQTAWGPVQAGGCAICEPTDGGTQFMFTGEAEVGGFFKLAEGLVAKQAEGQLEVYLGRLKAHLEGESYEV